ncbi:MAG: ribosomal RNA small subunit methyltransferase A [Candidatus Omnitrophica bacterium]|nr:ribosomal RNA small subunit methyltransferase A [Candidatus Omnitrophota bacterium]
MRVYPKKRLGQNFLIDLNIAKKIIEALELKKSDIILEIGSGRGELTSLIAPRVSKVYAVELDKRLKEAFSLRLKGYNNVSAINQDILKVDFKDIYRGRKKIKVFGNIPYYISSPIIEYLINNRAGITDAFITVQKEFAKRVVACPGSKDYGALSLFAQYYTLPKIILNISRGCFYPAPKVDSALLSLRFKDASLVPAVSRELLFRIIRSAFNQRRKTLRNSLKGIVEAKEIEEFLLRRKKSPNARPEELSLSNFADLASAST